jgi:hypothetical protein
MIPKADRNVWTSQYAQEMSKFLTIVLIIEKQLAFCLKSLQ